MRARQSNTTIHLSRLHARLELAKALCGHVIARAYGAQKQNGKQLTTRILVTMFSISFCLP